MTFLNIPKGRSDFETICRDGFYYVDKTGLIGEPKSSGYSGYINNSSPSLWKDIGNEYT